ncbi:hypothetical protein [Lentzea sp. NPDC092896]|uniref:hypothetical protein n=1 Tax=Lentzea sp. NPDC092896 TaxID=3364127 RepID=UPI00382DB7C8
MLPQLLRGTGVVERRFHADVAAALTGDRTYIVNVLEQPGLRTTERLVEAITERLGTPLVIADVGVLEGHGIGNMVIVSTEAELPVEELDRRTREARFPAMVWDPAQSSW